MNSKILIIFLLIGFSFYGCAPAPEETTPTSVKISMPLSDIGNRSIKSFSRSQKEAAVNPSLFGQADISTLDDIDCYFVGLTFKEGRNPGTCIGDIHIDEFKMASVTVADGMTIVMEEVPTAIPIDFHVFGFRNHDGSETCPDYRTLNKSQMANLSRASIVWTTRKTLEEKIENEVVIDISINNSIAINGCSDGPFQWAAGGVFGAGKFGVTKFGP